MPRKKTILFSSTDELLEGYGLKSQIGEKQASKAKNLVYLRGKKLASGNVSLFLDVCRDGKRTKQYLGTCLNLETSIEIKNENEKTYSIAKTVVNEKNVELQKNEAGFTISKKSKVNLITYILYQADEALKRSGNKHGYYYTLQALAKHISLYSGDNTQLKQVDKDYIKGFIFYLKTAKNINYQRTGTCRDKTITLGQNTQHNLFMKFKYVLRKAAKADVIALNPMDKLENDDKPKDEEGTREFLTVEEIKKLIVTPCKNDILKRAFLFCCLVGLRYSDIAAVTWGELAKDNDGSVILRFKMKKVKRGENAYISSEALKWLPERGEAKDNEIIFPLPKNDSANKQLARWVKSAGINKRITFHCSRHTAATLNLSLGTPIETVSKMMGHTKIATTQIYAKIIDQKQKEAVNKQNGIFD
ncbi:site-specific integrase [Bacteroides sp. GM023]|uniref:site-specific integrase n=1 Tax=Bacteroides sp. GM023 TaxID=2723058 RepID=UPI00168A773E|nr:site-specific integrase [Bacteroides sp. GM023]MBD3591581.1 site-specific integrase [Bacteroides sp. GM023]